MVSRDDLAQADILNQRALDLQRALTIVNDPTAAIDAFTVKRQPVPPPSETGGDVPAPEPQSVEIPAEGITTPPQMMTAIRQQLQARYDQIVQQLAAMGVTS